MKNVWMLAPSIRLDADDVFARWTCAGYHVAAFIDPGTRVPKNCSLAIEDRYEGYAKSINRLWREVTDVADIIIAGSDDLYPCADKSAQDLAADFFARFPDGFGVMHLAKYDLSQGQSTDHCWMGADYARRINRGAGPYWPDYYHFFDDTEAGEVADRLTVLWRRRDLGQRHAHWSLSTNQPPPHLGKAQSQWAISKALFEQRKHAGYPGHEPFAA